MCFQSADNLLDCGWWIRFDRGPLFSSDRDDVLVMDRRSGLKQREHVSGFTKMALKLMYDGWMGRVSGVAVTEQLAAMTVAAASRLDEEWTASRIEPFIALHHIDPLNLTEYKSLSAFLERNVAAFDVESASSIHGEGRHVLSPSSGRMVCFEQFRECSSWWVKGSKFSVQRLVGERGYEWLLCSAAFMVSENSKYSVQSLEALRHQNKIEHKKAVKEFSNKLSVCILRLSPGDYHGVHCPFNARCAAVYEIEGALYSVSPIVVNRDVNVLTENKRICIMFENEDSFGLCCMVIIASFLTAEISIDCKAGEWIDGGDLIAKFKGTDGCVVMLFPRTGTVRFDVDLIQNSSSRTRVETVVGLQDHIATVVQH